nr:hypothetical protein GCM10020093_018450 [Planobispora longispora]
MDAPPRSRPLREPGPRILGQPHADLENWGWPGALIVAADGRTCTVAFRSKIVRYSLPSLSVVHALDVPGVHGLTPSADQRRVVVESDGGVQVWDTVAGLPLTEPLPASATPEYRRPGGTWPSAPGLRQRSIPPPNPAGRSGSSSKAFGPGGDDRFQRSRCQLIRSSRAICSPKPTSRPPSEVTASAVTGCGNTTSDSCAPAPRPAGDAPVPGRLRRDHR